MITVIGVVLSGAVLIRILLEAGHTEEYEGNTPEQQDARIGIMQTTGKQEIQADVAHAAVTKAGMLAVLADGIGRANTGKLCAQMAADIVLDHYETYHILTNPVYFFKSTFAEAHRRIQQTIGDRRGGTSFASVFVNDTHIYYAVAGNIRIALIRNGELIPLNQGQTIDVLAVQAYDRGKITKKEAIWSMDEKRVWNYLGRDGFKEVELCERPIQIRQGDQILLLSKGIFEELSWGEIEDLIQEQGSAEEVASRIVWAAEEKKNPYMDNGSVLLIKTGADGGNR